MCGICGEIRFDAAPDFDGVRRMANELVHRGPDAAGYLSRSEAALGHRRLSILDHEGGAQPLTREHVTIVFNGEAYEFAELREELCRRGHAFSSRSDTEVVLRAYLEWGEEFASHVHGMFALAIWDARHRKLVLARDRLGKKPLYYALESGGAWLDSPAAADEPITATRVVFGSELKALLAHGQVPRSLDCQSAAQYLAVEYVPAPRSIFERIRKLPAAHIAVLDARGFRIRRYWELPAPDSSWRGSLEDAAGELSQRLEAAVARRLVADVPVGVFLSGGVDSTAITALAMRHKRPLSTFSIGFSEASFDESGFSRLASERLGTQHHSEMLSAKACLELLPDAVATLDEPFADPSFLPTLLLARFVRRSVTVALAGDGGDELFAGYDPFLAHRPAQILARLPGPVLELVSRLVNSVPPGSTNMSLDFRLKQLLRGIRAAPSLRHQSWIGSLLPNELQQVLVPELHAACTPKRLYREVLEECGRAQVRGVPPGSVDEALRFYLGRYLADDILVKADRASMAASLEVRAPFLDTHVVEFAARLPWQTKLSLTRTKVVLKRALVDLVPEEIISRPKKGFGIPVAQWIRGPLRPLYEDLFSEGSLKESGIFEVAPTQAMLQRHLRNQADLRKPLWTIAMFLLWQRRWGRGAPQGGAAMGVLGNSGAPGASR